MRKHRLAIAAALAILYVAPPALLFLYASTAPAAATPWINQLTILSVILVFQPGVFVLFLLVRFRAFFPVSGHPLALPAIIIVLSSALFWMAVFYLLLIAIARYKTARANHLRQ